MQREFAVCDDSLFLQIYTQKNLSSMNRVVTFSVQLVDYSGVQINNHRSGAHYIARKMVKYYCGIILLGA
jgi:hypothetical protein